MDYDLVSESQSESEEGSGDKAAALSTYTEAFNNAFPYYLAIGMNYEQYWNGDCALVRAYRKAEEMRNQRANREMWWQGRYIYEALCCASPLFHDLAKKGTTAAPYPDRPHPITEEEVRQEEERKAKAAYERGKNMFAQLMAEQKGG